MKEFVVETFLIERKSE